MGRWPMIHVCVQGSCLAIGPPECNQVIAYCALMATLEVVDIMMEIAGIEPLSSSPYTIAIVRDKFNLMRQYHCDIILRPSIAQWWHLNYHEAGVFNFIAHNFGYFRVECSSLNLEIMMGPKPFLEEADNVLRLITVTAPCSTMAGDNPIVYVPFADGWPGQYRASADVSNKCCSNLGWGLVPVLYCTYSRSN